MSNSNSERRYTEKEVRQILGRVGELQSTSSIDSPAAGTTLEQLQQAAAELGFDPELVSRAATEIGTGSEAGTTSWLVGGPWNLVSDHIVPGRVDEENWSALVEDIRAFTGRVGTPSRAGNLYEWKSSQPYFIHLSITPSGDQTRVRITYWDELPTIFTYALIGLTTLFALVALAVASRSSAGTIPFFVLLAALGSWRWSLPRKSKKFYGRFRELANFLERRVGELPVAQSIATTSATTENLPTAITQVTRG